MPSALESRPVRASDLSFMNRQYLYGCAPVSDPTMVWGTDVDAEELTAFVKEFNRSSDTLISVAHVLVKAVGCGLARYPELNARIIRGRIYRFREINVRMISFDQKASDTDILTIKRADRASLQEIGQDIWTKQLEISSGVYPDRVDKALLNRGPTFYRRLATKLFWWADRNMRLPRVGRIDRHLDSSVVVNYLGFAHAAPMRTYKPSKFLDESSLLSVTLGRTEEKPVVLDGQIVARRVAPMFIRADHRITDAHLLSRFIAALRGSLENPQTMNLPASDVRSVQGKAA